MKSKFTTYLLIAVVVILWGVIVWRVFFSSPAKVGVQPVKIDRPESIKQEIELLLNYRDPFKPVPKPVVKSVAKPNTVKVAPMPKRRVDMNFMGYLECGKTVNYVVEIAGTQYTISKGEEIDGVKLTKVFADSLQFNIQGVSYTLPITH